MDEQSTPISYGETKVLLREHADVRDQLARTPKDAHDDRTRLVAEEQRLRAEAVTAELRASTAEIRPTSFLKVAARFLVALVVVASTLSLVVLLVGWLFLSTGDIEFCFFGCE